MRDLTELETPRCNILYRVQIYQVIVISSDELYSLIQFV